MIGQGSLYGVTTTQFYMYTLRSKKYPTILIAMACIVWYVPFHMEIKDYGSHSERFRISDTVHTACMLERINNYAITGFGDYDD